MKIIDIIRNNVQGQSQQLLQIINQFKQDQFDVISQLEDIILANESKEEFIQSSSILIYILMKEFKDDKYRIEATFNNILQHYLKQDSFHLIEILSFLVVHFNSFIYLDGDMLLKYLISSDIERTSRILQLLTVALQPLKNQIESNQLSIQLHNLIQKQVVQIIEVHNLIEGLLRVSEKNIPIAGNNKKKVSAKGDMSDTLKLDNIQRQSVNCLLQLRNHLTKGQQKKVIQLLIKGINEIDVICNNDPDLISEYFYYLFQNKDDFQKGKEVKVFDQFSHMIIQYTKQVIISAGCYSFKTVEKSAMIQSIEQIEDIFISKESKEQSYRNLIKERLIKKNPSRFLICKYTCLEFSKKLLYTNIQEKFLNPLFNLVIHVAILPFSTYLQNKEVPEFDFDLQQQLLNLYEILCEEIKIKNLFFDHILKLLSKIDHRSEIQHEQIEEDASEQQQKSIFKNLQKGIKIVKIEDRFILIGIYQILENLASTQQEDIKGYSIKLIDYLSYQLLDEYVFNYSIAFFSEMANCFNGNILQFYKSFVPQLVLLFDKGDVVIKYKVADSLQKLFQELPNQKIKEVYQYLREILLICVREYTSQEFFSNKEHQSYYENVQKLISNIIELRQIQFYLKDEIIQAQQKFLQMILDKDKRDHLIQNNHQLCMLGFLKIEDKLKCDLTDLRNEIIKIAKDLSQKIYQKGKNVPDEERILIYQFMSGLTVKVLGSQEIYDLIILHVLPTAICDASASVIYIPKDLEIDERSNSSNESLEEDEEEEEDEELGDKADLKFKQPTPLQIDLVVQSLTLLGIFSEQSTDLFFNHKKFEILKAIQKHQIDYLVADDVMVQSQWTIGKILVSVQQYLTKLEQESNEENPLYFTENSIVEMSPLVSLMLHRLKIQPKDHDEELDFQYLSNQAIVSQNFDKILGEFQNTLDMLNSKTAHSFFDEIFSSIESTLYDTLSKVNPGIVDLCLISINLLLQLAPTKILSSLKSTWKMVEAILTSDSNIDENITYDQFKSLIQLDSKNEKKDKKQIQIKIKADPFMVIQCISQLQDLLQYCPQSYHIIHPVYHSIIMNEDFSKYEQYIQYVCQYIKRIVSHCSEYLDKAQILSYYNIFEQLTLRIDRDYYRELSPIENLRITFAMLGTLVYDNLSQEQNNSINCFEAFLEYIPLFDETLEYPFVFFIFQSMIKLDIQLNVNQRDKILKQLLFAIDNPSIHQIKQSEIANTLNMIKYFQEKYQNTNQSLINIIQTETLTTQKEQLLKYLSLKI